MPSPARISNTGTSSGSHFHWHTNSWGWDQWLSNPAKETRCWVGGKAHQVWEKGC